MNDLQPISRPGEDAAPDTEGRGRAALSAAGTNGRRGPGRAAILALLVMINLVWGSSWVVAKVALRELRPLQLAGWRMIVAGLVMLPWLARGWRRGEVTAAALPALAGLGLLAFVASKALHILGVNQSTGMNASLLMALEPLLTVAFAWLLLRERMTRRKGLGMALGCGGAYLIVSRGGAWPDFSLGGAVGDVIFTGGLALEALYSVWGKVTVRDIPPTTVNAATISLALLCWIPIVAVDGALYGWPRVTWSGAAAVAYLALGCTVVAYLVWLYALRRMEAGATAMTLLLQPVFGAALSAWVLGDTLPAAGYGTALVLVGLYLVLREEGKG